jgi:hypothetical protein
VLVAHLAQSSNRLPQAGFAARPFFRISHPELFEKPALPEFKHHEPPNYEIVIRAPAKKLVQQETYALLVEVSPL